MKVYPSWKLRSDFRHFLLILKAISPYQVGVGWKQNATNSIFSSLTTSLNTFLYTGTFYITIKKIGRRTEPILTFGVKVTGTTSQNLHSVHSYLRIRNVLNVFFWFSDGFAFFGSRTGNRPSKPTKMTFLLFCVFFFHDLHSSCGMMHRSTTI